MGRGTLYHQVEIHQTTPRIKVLMVKQPIPYGTTNEGNPVGRGSGQQRGPNGRWHTRQIQGVCTGRQGRLN
jgi:hypothetical protein